MARNPFSQKMEGFTAVVPSVTQGDLGQKLVPINSAKSMSPEQAAMLSKWRGLKTSDLTGKSRFQPQILIQKTQKHTIYLKPGIYRWSHGG